MGNENAKGKESGTKQGNDVAATAAQATRTDRFNTKFYKTMHRIGSRKNTPDDNTSNETDTLQLKEQATQSHPLAPREEHIETPKRPWRSLEKSGSWDENYKRVLIKEIEKIAINSEDVNNIRILLLGPITSGKSSFLNSVASIDKGRISQVTIAGAGGKSFTRKLKVFRPQGRLKNFRLLDTMGIEETELGGFNIKDLLYAIKGHILPDYQFNPSSPISEDSKDFKKTPKSKDKIHCVVFVIDANVIGQDNISDATRKKIDALQTELINIDIPRIVLITKIDVLCEMTGADPANCFISESIKNAVDLAEEVFGVPKQNIFPVQNYSEGMEMDTKKDILSLLALRQMMYFGADFLNDISAKTSDDEESS